jgi:hypothetical protein
MLRYALVAFLVSGCASAPAAGGQPRASTASEPEEKGVVAIPEPESDVEVDDQPAPVARGSRDTELDGLWIEDWPNRGGCADRIRLFVQGRRVELEGSDCNDGEAYEYSDAELRGRTLTFKLRVKSTNRVLDYALDLKDNGELVGPVTGGAEATVTWRRTDR